MTQGAGKYDAICTEAREKAKAAGAALMIVGGEYGAGFSVQAPAEIILILPRLLRQMASAIEADVKAPGNADPKAVR